MVTFKEFYAAESALKTVAHGAQAVGRVTTPTTEKESRALNILQGALDIAGLEPTVGMFADGGNTVISLLRAAAAKTSDTRNKHLINAGISAVSLIPFADIMKWTKLKSLSRPAAKAYVTGARTLKAATAARKAASMAGSKLAAAGISKAAVKNAANLAAKGGRVFRAVDRATDPAGVGGI